MSVTPTELIHFQLSTLHTFFCFPSSSGPSESFGSGTESSQACNVLQASPVTPSLNVENINISNLHDFKTVLPALDVPKQLQALSDFCYVCVCVCVHVCMRIGV